MPPDSREKMCRNRWHKGPEIQEGGHSWELLASEEVEVDEHVLGYSVEQCFFKFLLAAEPFVASS